MAGRIVNMDCPAVEFEGTRVGPMSIKALWSVRDPDLWVELKPENLVYLSLFMKRGLAEHIGEEPQERRRKKLRTAGPVVAKSPRRRSRRARRRPSSPPPVEDGEAAAVEACTESDDEAEQPLRSD